MDPLLPTTPHRATCYKLHIARPGQLFTQANTRAFRSSLCRRNRHAHYRKVHTRSSKSSAMSFCHMPHCRHFKENLVIRNVFTDEEHKKEYPEASTSPYVQAICQSAISAHTPAYRRIAPSVTLRRPARLFTTNNIDLKVLLPENQNRTTVTPLIFSLGHAYFRPEEMKLLDRSFGYRPSRQQRQLELRRRRKELFEFLRNARQSKGEPVFPHQYQRYHQYWDRILLGRVEYKVCPTVNHE
jgi:hypothetical protein